MRIACAVAFSRPVRPDPSLAGGDCFPLSLSVLPVSVLPEPPAAACQQPLKVAPPVSAIPLTGRWLPQPQGHTIREEGAPGAGYAAVWLFEGQAAEGAALPALCAGTGTVCGRVSLQPSSAEASVWDQCGAR